MKTGKSYRRSNKRPSVTNPARPADQYAMPGERIIEFWDDAAQAGGLISFNRLPGNDGHATLSVHVYRFDVDRVSVSHAQPAIPATLFLDVEDVANLQEMSRDQIATTRDRLARASTTGGALQLIENAARVFVLPKVKP